MADCSIGFITSEYLEVEYPDPEKLRLKETVFVAYNDVNAAGM